METNTFDYKKLRSEIFLKYHIELDETSLSILHILLSETKAELSAMTQSIRAATDKVNNSTTSLQVDYHHPRWQAFWFGMGKLGFAIVFTVAVTSVFLSVYLDNAQPIQSLSNKQSYQLSWYKTYYILSQKGNPKELKHFIKDNPVPKNE